MAAENLSTGIKKTIVVGALIGIIGLKLIGALKGKLPWYLIIALAGISVITDPSPTGKGTLDSVGLQGANPT